jgi:soluble lytic murein transglycosylase-like protein
MSFSALHATLILAAAPVTVPPPCPFAREVRAAVASVAGVHAVPEALVHAVMRQESSCRPLALSRAGARGLMQIMPANAGRLGVTTAELWVPAKNISAGVRLLAVLLRHYRGDIISALVAYNARPRKLFAPLPRNGETPRYVWRVLGFYRAYEREFVPAPSCSPQFIPQSRRRSSSCPRAIESN